MTSTEKAIQKAIELVDASPSGKRYSELVKEISSAFANIPVNTIHGSLHKFRTELPKTTVGKILRRELVRQHKEGEK